MRHLRPSRPALWIPAVLALASSACTLIGMAVGHGVDSKRKKQSPPVKVDGWEITKVGTGERIVVTLETGERIEGKYAGLEGPTPAAEYAPRYAEAQARMPDVALPALDGRVVTESVSGGTLAGAFAGFQSGSVLVKDDGKPMAEPVHLRDMKTLRTEGGREFTGAQLRQLVTERRIPVRTGLLVGDQRVALDRVKTVEYRRGGHSGMVTGAVLGLIVDTLVVVAAMESLNQPWNTTCRTPNCVNSCPYVYSFDGQMYVLDAEPFGQALFEAAQRPDWTRMDHLRAADGTFRLRIVNELDEIEYVDELKLLLAEVPAGARLVPSADGRLHVLAAPQPPAKARTLAGSDARALLRARDDSAWTSAPFANAAFGESAGRDGIVLEFARPPGARQVTLAFTARSTPWASHLLTRVLALHGREQPAWTARMNRDAAARREFASALRREGLLAVSLWDGTRWRDQGVLLNQGPAVWKEQAIGIDLRGVEGIVLRVRVDVATPGLWMIDSVAADFGGGPAPRVRELRPSIAHDVLQDRDVRDLLAAADHRRLVMRRGDVVELSFPAPVPPAAGRVALVPVLEAAGYYEIQLPAKGEPNRALYQRLMREPGAFGAYARAGLRSKLERTLAAD